MALINDTRRLRDLDPAVLARYNLIGPRYTSYPTAPEWTETIGPDAVREHWNALHDAPELDVTNPQSAIRNPQFPSPNSAFRIPHSAFSSTPHSALRTPQSSSRPLSFYVHIPFCLERCAFCACNVIVSPHRDRVCDPYLDLVEREAALYADLIDTDRPVVQFHWGGGTPTYLNPAQIERAHAAVADRFHFAEGVEKSIEIHVTWTSDEQLRTLAALGFNRLSLGVQDFSEATQRAIRRRQTYERTRQIIEFGRALGFKGINIDLIYGLPHQSAATFGATIDRVLELRPDRLAVYNFAFLPGRMAHQRVIDPATLPAGEEKFRILLEAHDRLVGAGYRYIGMDHFALPDDELARAFDEGTMQRNFMGFTTRAGADLVGLGVSAIGAPSNLYAQNVKKLTEYRALLEAGRLPIERGLLLSTDDLIRREVIAGLMCRDHVDKREIESRFGIVFDNYFASELERLQPMIADELLEVHENSLDLNFLGRVFVRNIAMVFDAYLTRPKEGKEKVVYSRTL